MYNIQRVKVIPEKCFPISGYIELQDRNWKYVGLIENQLQGPIVLIRQRWYLGYSPHIQAN